MLKGRPADLQAPSRRRAPSSMRRPGPCPRVELGLQRGAGGVQGGPRTRFATFVKATTSRSPARCSRTRSSSARQESQHRGARALFGDAAPAIPKDADLVLVWGEGLDFGLIRRGEDRVPERVAAAGERPRRRVHPDLGPDRARRPLHELRRRHGAFSKCFAKPVVSRTRRRSSSARRNVRRWRMIADLVIALVFIGYAISVLMVSAPSSPGGAQAGRGDVGPHRRQPRLHPHPFTQVKLVWLDSSTAWPTG